jgi:hypothetical protein
LRIGAALNLHKFSENLQSGPKIFLKVSASIKRRPMETAAISFKRIKNMKSVIWRTLLALAATGACVSSLTAAAQTENRMFEGLEGSWTVQVTQLNCETGAPLGSPFLSLLTFAKGGTLVETTSNPMFFPAVRGPGHGVWSYSNDHSFKAESVAFITLDGALVKTQTISQTIEMREGPNTFKTTSASVVFVPVAGGPTVTGCASAVGKRIE